MTNRPLGARGHGCVHHRNGEGAQKGEERWARTHGSECVIRNASEWAFHMRANGLPKAEVSK